MLAPLGISRAAITSAILLVFGIAATEGNAFLLRSQSGVYDIDTEYSRIQVFKTKDPATGKEIRALATDPYFVQSATFPDNDDLVLEYSRYYHLIRHFKPTLKRTLVIGGAGYSFPRSYLREYPDATIDVVEIDPQMTEIARRHFRLKDDPRLAIFHEDGRMFINRTASGSYDAILMDAFGSLFSVPTHLTTVEAVNQLSRLLADDGVLIFNLGSAITGPGSQFLHTELTTYRSVFPQVHLFKVNADYPDERLQNLIIVACKSPSQIRMTSPEPSFNSLLARRYDLAEDDPHQILTDDLAPVERYNSIAQNIYLAEPR